MTANLDATGPRDGHLSPRIVRTDWPRAVALFIGLTGAIGGCGGPEPAAPPPAAVVAPTRKVPPTPPREGRQTYTLRGVVRAVDAAEGEVTIDHEAIPGFMGAMVMPFMIRDKAVLEDVRPGDLVHGPIVVDFKNDRIKNYELTDLTVTGVDAAAIPTPASLRPAPLAVGEPVPDFTVTTQTGATLHLADLRGKVVALTFIYTRCPLPDFCPAVDAKFAEVDRRVTALASRADQVMLLSVSFDPAHDTPEVLARHAQLRGAKPPWIFAVASHEELARIGPLLGLDYFPDRDQFGHNLTTALIGPDGRLARLELGRAWTPADLTKAMIHLIPPREQPGPSRATPASHGQP